MPVSVVQKVNEASECSANILIHAVDQLYSPRVAAGQSAAPEVVHDINAKAEEQGRQGCYAACIS